MRYDLHKLTAVLVTVFLAAVLAFALSAWVLAARAPIGAFADAYAVATAMLQEAMRGLMLTALGGVSLELVIRRSRREENKENDQ